jgi:hypothetical protein
VIAILAYPIAFLGLTFWMSYFYAGLSRRYGVGFTARARFLSAKYRPDRMIFSFGWICRGFLVSLLPVMANGLYQVQVGLIMATFIAWLVLQTSFKCWRFPLINTMDSILGSAMVFILFGFALLGSGEGMEESSCGWFIISLAILTVIAFALAGGRTLAKRVSSRTEYGVCITHHKAAVGVYARQIKMLFDFPGSSPPFLDVDNLDHLDCSSFAVTSSSLQMTILSESVLERPWCALEIATAYVKKVPRVAVHINLEVLDLSDSYIEQAISSYSRQDWTIFAQFGITESILRAAFMELAKLPKFVLPLKSANQELLDTSVRDILSKGAGKLTFQRPKYVADPSKVLHIAYDTRDPIQCSAAYVAKQLFSEGSWDARLCCPTEQGGHGDFAGSKGVGIVFMSEGLRTDTIALGAIVAMKRAGRHLVTAVCRGSFSKPDADFYNALRSGQILLQESLGQVCNAAPNATLDEIALALSHLDTILTSGFGPEQNQRMMRQEFEIMEQRAKEALERSPVPWPSVNDTPNHGVEIIIEHKTTTAIV